MARQKRQTKESVHYVNNKEFTAAIIEHNKACRIAEESGVDKPRVTEYIGECIYKIATRLSTKPNFINYSYRDEMICDGIENCLQYIENFNEEKSQNAFAYVTQIIYFAFLRRIHKEKKQAAIKQKSIQQAGFLFDTFDTLDGEVAPGMSNQYIDFLQENQQEINYKPRGSKKKD
tara:strand:- start:1743 stop:2267 length:525 start_codon:yes stop_codon:yes gene_type:complete